LRSYIYTRTSPRRMLSSPLPLSFFPISHGRVFPSLRSTNHGRRNANWIVTFPFLFLCAKCCHKKALYISIKLSHIRVLEKIAFGSLCSIYELHYIGRILVPLLIRCKLYKINVFLFCEEYNFFDWIYIIQEYFIFASKTMCFIISYIK